MDPGVARPIVGVVEPFGTLFVNAIRMTVMPLVVSSLIVGIASRATARCSRASADADSSCSSCCLRSPACSSARSSRRRFSRAFSSIRPRSRRCARASPSATASRRARSAIQGPAAWLVSLVPSNAISAAVDGAMLPLIVFALALGLALGRVDDSRAQRSRDVLSRDRRSDARARALAARRRADRRVRAGGAARRALGLAPSARSPCMSSSCRSPRRSASSSSCSIRRRRGRRRVPLASSPAPRFRRRPSHSRRGRRSPRCRR